MLAKKIRLTKRGSFAYVYKKGRGAATKSVRMLFVPSSSLKIGISVSNKIGKAVVRNLIKRRMRAVLRVNLGKISIKGQIVFVAKEGIDKLEYSEIEKDMRYLIEKLRFL